MTLQELNTYLTSRVGGQGAQVTPQLQKMAEIAIAGAYNHVWGQYRWTARRGNKTLTASAATTACPDNFERCRWIACQFTGQKASILIRSEENFDYNHPYPSDDGTGMPNDCKIVYDGNTNTWKIYWWPVPDQSYSMVMSYDMKADVAFFPKLPSHMVKAVQAQALSLMMSGDAQGGNLEMLAVRALKEAIDADTEVSGVLPMFGEDQGWNDFDADYRSPYPSGVGNPLHW